MSCPQIKTAIIGGGPAGLTLGVLLHKRGIAFTISERRQEPSDEELAKPAGSLDLHEGSGLSAIKACDLLDEFTTLTGDCTEASKICDKNGKIIYSDDGDFDNRPEISRHKLSKLLLSHLPASAVKWGYKLRCTRSCTVSGDAEIELDFGDHGKQIFDLVIGADGTWSRLRPLLTDVKPQYAGIQTITMDIRHVTTRHPRLAELIGTGTFTCLGDRHGVFSQRSVGDSARIYVFISTADKHFATTKDLSGRTPAQAKDQLLGENLPFGGWGNDIRDLVAVACEEESADNPGKEIDVRPLYTLPVGHSWEHRAGATLIGDAAHVLNPPAGEGVNIAMQDSLLLSQAIIRAHESARQDGASLRSALDPLIREFEVDMAGRAKRAGLQMKEVSGTMLGEGDSATAMAEWFKSFVPHSE